MKKDGEKYLIVVNPVGRGGKAQEDGMWLIDRFRKLGINHEALFTEKLDHARELVSNWVEPVDVVVAVGGDGTINEVINGIMDSKKNNTSFALLPSGTADDFARNMKIPHDREKALKVILGEETRKIDLIKVNGKYAGLIFSIGLEAKIAHLICESKRFKLLAYWYHGLSMLFKRLPKSPLVIDIAGEHLHKEFILIVVCNANRYGRYMKTIPDACMDDGVINLATFDMMNRFKILLLFFLSMRGWNFWPRQMNSYRGESMRIECLDDVYGQFDGEVVMFNRGEVLNIKVEPLAIKVRSPVVKVKKK
jgi:YegS/Rv2252/BmrU family lipid kinase